jgi:2-epi-5-epi-valiolone synthase
MQFNCRLERRYTVHVVDPSDDESDRRPLAAAIRSRHCLLVTTPTVNRLYGAALTEALQKHDVQVTTVCLPLTEQCKSMASVARICDIAQQRSLQRTAVVLSVGGGVCSDIAGFAASMLRRGISHIRIPTTLIGQVDAGVGVKTGVNLGRSKNYLGAYYPPEFVYVNPAYLRSLPDSGICQGLAEIIKIAIVASPELFEMVDASAEELVDSGAKTPASMFARVITSSIALMLEQLQSNPYEQLGSPRLVDFAHTVSPELESRSDYTLPHGLAVAQDIAFSTALAVTLGLCSERLFSRIETLLRRCELPIHSNLLTLDAVQYAMSQVTAHRAGRLNLIVPRQIGHAHVIENVSDIPRQAIEDALDLLWKH